MPSPAASEGDSPVENSSPQFEEGGVPALSSSPTRTGALKRVREQSLEPTSLEQEGERSDTRAPAKRIRRSGDDSEVPGDKTPTRDRSPADGPSSARRSPRLSKPPSPIPEDDNSESGGESPSSMRHSPHGDEREVSPDVPASAEGPHVKEVRKGVRELSMPEDRRRPSHSTGREDEKEDDYVFVDRDTVPRDAEADNVEMAEEDGHTTQAASSVTVPDSLAPLPPNQASSAVADAAMSDSPRHEERVDYVSGETYIKKATDIDMKEDDKPQEFSALTADLPSSFQNGNASPVEGYTIPTGRASRASIHTSPPRPPRSELEDAADVAPLVRKRKVSTGRVDDEEQRQKAPPKSLVESFPVVAAKMLEPEATSSAALVPKPAETTTSDLAKAEDEVPKLAQTEETAVPASPVINGFAAFRMGKLNFSVPSFLTPGASTSTPSTSSTSSAPGPSSSNVFGGGQPSSSGLFGSITPRTFGQASSDIFSSSAAASVFSGPTTNVFGSGGSFSRSEAPALGGSTSVFGSTSVTSPVFGVASTAGTRTAEEKPGLKTAAVGSASGSEQSKAERPIVEGEEGEVTVDSAYATLYENGKGHGSGPIKLNIRPEEDDRGRLIMRASGNLRVILNLWLYKDMPPIFVGEKFIRVLCPEDKGVVVKDIKFHTGEIRARFFESIEQWRPKQPRMLASTSSGPSTAQAAKPTLSAPPNDASEEPEDDSQPLAAEDDDEDASETSLEDSEDEADAEKASSQEARGGSDTASLDREPNEKDEEQETLQVEAELSEEDEPNVDEAQYDGGNTSAAKEEVPPPLRDAEEGPKAEVENSAAPSGSA